MQFDLLLLRSRTAAEPLKPRQPLPSPPQGTGPEVAKVDDAMDVATKFASMKL